MIRVFKLFRLTGVIMNKTFTIIFVAILAISISFLVGNMSIYRNIVFYIKGLREFTKKGYETASQSFNPADTDVDCSSRSFMITGANSGIGFDTAYQLALKNCTVHIVCRNPIAGADALEKLKTSTKNDKIHLHIVDMSQPKQIYEFTQKFSKNSQLDVLVNNAGCLLNECKRTNDDLDMNFATNTLGYYLLTRELSQLLSKSEDPRVVFVSSGGMYTQKLEYEDFTCPSGTSYNGLKVYAQNKRQQVVMCKEFAKMHTKIFFASMHPGWADTPGVQTSISGFYEKHKSQFRTSSEGADTIVWLSLVPKSILEKFQSGLFFLDRQPTATHLPLAWTKSTGDEQSQFMTKLKDLSEKVLSN